MRKTPKAAIQWLLPTAVRAGITGTMDFQWGNDKLRRMRLVLTEAERYMVYVTRELRLIKEWVDDEGGRLAVIGVQKR